jgi:hypothetical protein
MRNALLFGFVLTLLLGSCKYERRLAIEGSWRMVYGEWMASDSSTYPATIVGSQIKSWTKEYFTFVGEFKHGDGPIDATYGGGTYSLIGKQYTENPVYHNSKAYLGHEVRILLEIKGDTLIQRWPATADWKLPEKFCMEKYIRLK